MWGVCLTHIVLSWFSAKSFSYTSLSVSFFFIRGTSLTHPLLASILCGVSLTHPILDSFSFLFIRGVSLTHPALVLIWSADFFLHKQCRFDFQGMSFSYTSRAGFILYLGSFSYTSDAGFFFFSSFFLLLFIWGVSLTHLMLTLFLCEDFLLHTPRCLHYYAGSFSYTSRADFVLKVFIGGVSLTHPVLTSFSWKRFLLYIPSWIHFRRSVLALLFFFFSSSFFVGSFCYTSRAGFTCFVGSFSYTSRAGFFL